MRAAVIFGLGTSPAQLKSFQGGSLTEWQQGIPTSSSDADAILIFGGDGTIHRHLPALVRLVGDEPPVAVQAAAKSLHGESVRCVNLGIGRENLTDKHWIYYPEDTVFQRILAQGAASPFCNPPGGFGLTCGSL